MKLFLSLAISLILSACADEDCCVNPEVNEAFIGEWKHTQSCFSPGGPQVNCSDFEGNEVYTFGENGSFSVTNDQGTFSGGFSVNYVEPNNTPDFLHLDIQGEVEDPVRVYKVHRLEGNVMQLNLHSDEGLPRCIEACYEEFVRE